MLFMFFVGAVSHAQVVVDSLDTTAPALSQEAEQIALQKAADEAKKVEKETKKAEKEAKKKEKQLKKAEKAKKQAEKEIKKRAKQDKIIANKRKSIAKKERDITNMENKLAKKKIKGKLTPIDEMEMNQKMDKIRLNILREKEKLSKLERKQ